MARSLYTDTDSMRVVGNSTKSNAEEYLVEIGKIYNYIDDLASRWKCADNQAYASKTNEYRPDMEKLQDLYQGLVKLLQHQVVLEQLWD